MSLADPFSSRFEVFGREPNHVLGEINHQPFEKLKRLLDLGEGGDGRVVLLRAPRAGYGKTSLLQRLASEFSESHQFVRVNLVSGRTTDATHVLEYVLQALCQVLPDSSTLTKLDNLSRRVLALGLEPLVASGEVPCQDREGALVALREQPTETFDFHHDRAVTAHWTKSNFEILGPRLAAELGRVSGASLRETSYWVELLFRFATTAPDNVERARLLFETVFRGDLQNQSGAEERLHGLLAILGTVTSLVLIVDDTEGLSTHPPDALALACFLTNLSQVCPGTLVVLSVNEDIWESAFLPLLPGGLADRLTEHDVKLRPLTREEARDLVEDRAGDRADEILAEIDWGTGDLYARQVLKAASDIWENLEHAPVLEVVTGDAEAADDEEEDRDEEDVFADELDDLDDESDEEFDSELEPADEEISGEDASEDESEADIVEGEKEEEPVAESADEEEEEIVSPFAGKEDDNAEDEEEESANAVADKESSTPFSPFSAVMSAPEPEADLGAEEEKETTEEAARDTASDETEPELETASPFASNGAEEADSETESTKVFSATGDETPESGSTDATPEPEEAASPFAAAPEQPALTAGPGPEEPSGTTTAEEPAEGEPNPFLAKEPGEPAAPTVGESIFAKAGEPPAEDRDNPFLAKSPPAFAEADAQDKTGEEDASDFPDKSEETAPVAANPFGVPPSDESPKREVDKPVSAEADTAENPFAPKFGQPLAPPLADSAPAPAEDFAAPFSAAAPPAPEAIPPTVAPSPSDPAPDFSAFSPPPALPPEAPPTPPPATPFAAGSPPIELAAPTFGPPPVPPAGPDPAPAQSLHEASEELAKAFQDVGEPPAAVPPPIVPPELSEPPAAPSDSEEPAADPEPAQPASPFATIGRTPAEKNLGEVSSIFAPIKPDEGSTLDPEKLSPLLDDADHAASKENSPAPEPQAAPPAFTAGAAPSAPLASPSGSDNPFSAGTPPSEPPASPANPTPFSPVAATPEDSPFSAGPAAPTFQPVGPPPVARDAGAEGVFAPAPAPDSPSAPAPAPGLGSSSGFGATALGPFSGPAEAPPSREPADTASTEEKSTDDNEDSRSNGDHAASPFAERVPPASDSDSPSESLPPPPVELTSTASARNEVSAAGGSPLAKAEDQLLDTPFKPVAAPQAQDASASPFAKAESVTASAPLRAELPPKQVEVSPTAGAEGSPFEPGQPPGSTSFESPAGLSAGPAPSAPVSAPSFESPDTGPDSVSGPGAGDDSSPFSAIGQPSSGPPPDFAPASEPVGQDKVDELLRQFKERYGRK